MFNDSEVNVVTLDEELARRTRLGLWEEHLETADVDGDPTQRRRRAVASRSPSSSSSISSTGARSRIGS